MGFTRYSIGKKRIVFWSLRCWRFAMIGLIAVAISLCAALGLDLGTAATTGLVTGYLRVIVRYPPILRSSERLTHTRPCGYASFYVGTTLPGPEEPIWTMRDSTGVRLLRANRPAR